MGCRWHYNHPSEIMDEIARADADLRGRVVRASSTSSARSSGRATRRRRKARRSCTSTASCAARAGSSSPNMSPTDERTGPRFPLLLTTGRILSQYNVGAQTRRTANVVWHEEDVLEIHPHDAEQRGVRDGDWVKLASRAGETTLRAADHRPRRARRRLHDLPPSRHPGQRRHHRVFRLGDQLPGIQGDGGAGVALERPDANGRSEYDELAAQSRRIADRCRSRRSRRLRRRQPVAASDALPCARHGRDAPARAPIPEETRSPSPMTARPTP